MRRILTAVQHHLHARGHRVDAGLDGFKGVLIGEGVVCVPPPVIFRLVICRIAADSGTNVIIIKPCYDKTRRSAKKNEVTM